MTYMRSGMRIRRVALGVAVGVLARGAHAQSPNPGPLSLEYRWVGLGIAGPTHAVLDAQTGRTLAVSDSVVLDLAGVSRAEVVGRGARLAGWDVIARLRPAAARAFAEATAAHVGDDLGILLDGRVVQVAHIASRLGAVAGIVSGVPRPVADSVAARVNRASSGPAPD